MSNSSFADNKDVVFFNNLSSEWWDETNGGAKLLHRLNKIIVPYIQDSAINNGLVKEELLKEPKPLRDLHILEVGCAGGILTEPLAKTSGATIVGIDMGPDLIKVAKQHAALDTSLTNLTYKVESVEEHCLNNSEKYDIVVASGVLEHVDVPESFLEACVKCLKPGGSIFISTFAKSKMAYLMAITACEYILRLIPVGTHDWNKFVSPVEVQRLLEKYNCKKKEARGVFYNIITKKCLWIRNTSGFYILHAVKDLNV